MNVNEEQAEDSVVVTLRFNTIIIIMIIINIIIFILLYAKLSRVDYDDRILHISFSAPS